MSVRADSASVSQLLHQAFPVDEKCITHADLLRFGEGFDDKLVAMELLMSLKIKNSEVSQRNWILTGCIAIMLVFGGGYISVVSKLDRLMEQLPITQQTLDSRRHWMQRQEQRDGRQDLKLKQLDNQYDPMPYAELPN